MKETKISYWKFCWINHYIILFLIALAFTIGILIEVPGYDKLFVITPILTMIALIFGSRKGYNIYVNYPGK